MTLPSTTEGAPPREIERVQSRERAVSRITKGVWISVIGWVGMVTVPIADFVFGASQFTQEVWSIAGRSLVWLGVFVAASAGIHLLRFGGRRGKLAFASLAAAAGCGIVAVAEQFETWFLETQFLRGLDVWGLVGALVFFLLAMVLLTGDPRGNGRGGDGGPQIKRGWRQEIDRSIPTAQRMHHPLSRKVPPSLAGLAPESTAQERRAGNF